MTDIWRSFVALRILQENDQYLLFHEPTVCQDRNDHNLMKDFADEITGYQNNLKIVSTLESLKLKSGTDALPENLIKCYSALIEMGLVGKEEMGLVEAWIGDIGKL